MTRLVEGISHSPQDSTAHRTWAGTCAQQAAALMSQNSWAYPSTDPSHGVEHRLPCHGAAPVSVWSLQPAGPTSLLLLQHVPIPGPTCCRTWPWTSPTLPTCWPSFWDAPWWTRCWPPPSWPACCLRCATTPSGSQLCRPQVGSALQTSGGHMHFCINIKVLDHQTSPRADRNLCNGMARCDTREGASCLMWGPRSLLCLKT